MKLSKLLIFSPLLFATCQIYLYSFVKITNISPQSKQQFTDQRIKRLLKSANIEPINLKFKEFNHELEFLIMVKSQPVKVYLSTTNNLTSQVAALQKLFKIANIKEKQLTVVDLAAVKPYATF